MGRVTSREGEEAAAFEVPHAEAYSWDREPAAAAAAAASETAASGRSRRRFFFGPRRRGSSSDGPASREPRRGGRVAVGAACLVPLAKLGLDEKKKKKKNEAPEEEEEEEEEGRGDGDNGGGGSRREFAVVLAYSLHLECFCGASGRALQLGDVLRDADERLPKLSRDLLLLERKRRSEPSLVPSPRSSPPFLPPPAFPPPPFPPPPPRLFCSILGDLNTLAHGIVRLSPLRARGRARWSSLGRTEAEWLHGQLLSSREGGRGERRRRGRAPPSSAPAPAPPSSLFFECPFPLDTVTFDNPSYHFLGGRLRLVRGKLDWALLLKKERREKAKEKREKSWGRTTATATTTTATTGRGGDGQAAADEEERAALSASSCCYGGLRALSATTANDDFSASDHRALVVDVVAE